LGKTKKHKKKNGLSKQPRRLDRLVKDTEAHIKAQILALAEPLCAAEGMELVHLEFQRESRGRTMRLYIDKPGGVRLDDCVVISRQLGDLLDVSLAVEEAYNLEVSSPGVNRPLGKLSDYQRFKGQPAKIKLVHTIEGRKNLQGTLAGTEQEKIVLKVEDQRIVIDFNDIARAQLINYNGEK
jgi:ribosome maturation factor RimP